MRIVMRIQQLPHQLVFLLLLLPYKSLISFPFVFVLMSLYCCGTGICECVNPANRLFRCVLIIRGLDKRQRQVDKFKFRFYWVNFTQKVYRCRNRGCCITSVYLCWVSKVYIAESLRLSCLLVCVDSASRRWGWSLCLVLILGVAVWSGCRCSWRQSMMWTRRWQKLNDRWPGCALLSFNQSGGRSGLEVLVLVRAVSHPWTRCYRGCVIDVLVCSILG